MGHSLQGWGQLMEGQLCAWPLRVASGVTLTSLRAAASCPFAGENALKAHSALLAELKLEAGL